MADRNPMWRAANIDTINLLRHRVDCQNGIAELGCRPQRARGIHHDAMRCNIGANVDGALERLSRQIDHRDAAIRIVVLSKDAAAIDRRVDLAVRRADQLMRRSRHVEIEKVPKRPGIEPLNLVGALCSKDQRRAAGPVVRVDHVAPLSRSSASTIFALRPTASSRFSFSSSTTSSGARDTKFGLLSLASTRT